MAPRPRSAVRPPFPATVVGRDDPFPPPPTASPRPLEFPTRRWRAKSKKKTYCVAKVESTKEGLFPSQRRAPSVTNSAPANSQQWRRGLQGIQFCQIIFSPIFPPSFLKRAAARVQPLSSPWRGRHRGRLVPLPPARQRPEKKKAVLWKFGWLLPGRLVA